MGLLKRFVRFYKVRKVLISGLWLVVLGDVHVTPEIMHTSIAWRCPNASCESPSPYCKPLPACCAVSSPAKPGASSSAGSAAWAAGSSVAAWGGCAGAGRAAESAGGGISGAGSACGVAASSSFWLGGVAWTGMAFGRCSSAGDGLTPGSCDNGPAPAPCKRARAFNASLKRKY